MNLSSKDIEDIAVNEFNLICSKIEGLHSYVLNNDKTPNYDGDVYVYEYGKEEKIENIIGIVRTQLKGTCIELKNNKKQVKVNDLETYIKNGGCLYIVGYINTKNNCRVDFFYREFNEFNLRDMLKKKNKNKLSIEFKKFPKKDKDIYEVFKTAYYNKKNINVHEKVTSLEDVSNNKFEFKGLSVSGYGETELDVWRNISKGNILLQTIGKSEFSTPITADFVELIGNAKLVVERHEEVQVKLNGKVLYKKTKVGYENGKFRIKLSEHFHLLFNDDDRKINFDIRWSMLTETILDLKFLLNLFKAEDAVSWNYINDDKFNKIERLDQLIENKNENNYINLITEIEDKIQFFSYIQEKLKEFNLSRDLDVSNLTKEDYFNIGMLIGRNTMNSDLKNICLENTCYIKQLKISNINILVFILIKDNKYKVFNLFNNIDGLKFEIENKVASILTVLDEKQLESDNFNADFFIKDLKGNSDGNIDKYSQLLLCLIKVYDKNTSNKEIKSAMVRLAEFLYSEDKSDFVYYLNYLQVKFRLNSLEEKDLKKIEKIQKEKNDMEINLACEILMKNKKAAREIFNKLNKTERKKFKQYPIYTLFKNMKE